MGYDFLKQGANNLEAIGFGAAMPESRDRLLNLARNDPGTETAEDKRKKLELQQQAGARGIQMKKGGKVSSASKRADGCCVKGKTKGRMV